MSDLKNIQVNELLEKIRKELNASLQNNLSSSPVTKLNPTKWSNELGDFEFDGEHLFYKPNRPIESIKIDFKL